MLLGRQPRCGWNASLGFYLLGAWLCLSSIGSFPLLATALQVSSRIEDTSNPDSPQNVIGLFFSSDDIPKGGAGVLPFTVMAAIFSNQEVELQGEVESEAPESAFGKTYLGQVSDSIYVRSLAVCDDRSTMQTFMADQRNQDPKYAYALSARINGTVDGVDVGGQDPLADSLQIASVRRRSLLRYLDVHQRALDEVVGPENRRRLNELASTADEVELEVVSQAGGHKVGRWERRRKVAHTAKFSDSQTVPEEATEPGFGSEPLPASEEGDGFERYWTEAMARRMLLKDGAVWQNPAMFDNLPGTIEAISAGDTPAHVVRHRELLDKRRNWKEHEYVKLFEEVTETVHLSLEHQMHLQAHRRLLAAARKEREDQKPGAHRRAPQQIQPCGLLPSDYTPAQEQDCTDRCLAQAQGICKCYTDWQLRISGCPDPDGNSVCHVQALVDRPSSVLPYCVETSWCAWDPSVIDTCTQSEVFCQAARIAYERDLYLNATKCSECLVLEKRACTWGYDDTNQQAERLSDPITVCADVLIGGDQFNPSTCISELLAQTMAVTASTAFKRAFTNASTNILTLSGLFAQASANNDEALRLLNQGTQRAETRLYALANETARLEAITDQIVNDLSGSLELLQATVAAAVTRATELDVNFNKAIQQAAAGLGQVNASTVEFEIAQELIATLQATGNTQLEYIIAGASDTDLSLNLQRALLQTFNTEIRQDLRNQRALTSMLYQFAAAIPDQFDLTLFSEFDPSNLPSPKGRVPRPPGSEGFWYRLTYIGQFEMPPYYPDSTSGPLPTPTYVGWSMNDPEFAQAAAHIYANPPDPQDPAGSADLAVRLMSQSLYNHQQAQLTRRTLWLTDMRLFCNDTFLAINRKPWTTFMDMRDEFLGPPGCTPPVLDNSGVVLVPGTCNCWGIQRRERCSYQALWQPTDDELLFSFNSFGQAAGSAACSAGDDDTAVFYTNPGNEGSGGGVLPIEQEQVVTMATQLDERFLTTVCNGTLRSTLSNPIQETLVSTNAYPQVDEAQNGIINTEIMGPWIRLSDQARRPDIWGCSTDTRQSMIESDFSQSYTIPLLYYTAGGNAARYVGINGEVAETAIFGTLPSDISTAEIPLFTSSGGVEGDAVLTPQSLSCKAIAAAFVGPYSIPVYLWTHQTTTQDLTVRLFPPAGSPPGTQPLEIKKTIRLSPQVGYDSFLTVGFLQCLQQNCAENRIGSFVYDALPNELSGSPDVKLASGYLDYNMLFLETRNAATASAEFGTQPNLDQTQHRPVTIDCPVGSNPDLCWTTTQIGSAQRPLYDRTTERWGRQRNRIRFEPIMQGITPPSIRRFLDDDPEEPGVWNLRRCRQRGTEFSPDSGGGRGQGVMCRFLDTHVVQTADRIQNPPWKGSKPGNIPGLNDGTGNPLDEAPVIYARQRFWETDTTVFVPGAAFKLSPGFQAACPPKSKLRATYASTAGPTRSLRAFSLEVDIAVETDDGVALLISAAGLGPGSVADFELSPPGGGAGTSTTLAVWRNQVFCYNLDFITPVSGLESAFQTDYTSLTQSDLDLLNTISVSPSQAALTTYQLNVVANDRTKYTADLMLDLLDKTAGGIPGGNSSDVSGATDSLNAWFDQMNLLRDELLLGYSQNQALLSDLQGQVSVMQGSFRRALDAAAALANTTNATILTMNGIQQDMNKTQKELNASVARAETLAATASSINALIRAVLPNDPSFTTAMGPNVIVSPNIPPGVTFLDYKPPTRGGIKLMVDWTAFNNFVKAVSETWKKIKEAANELLENAAECLSKGAIRILLDPLVCIWSEVCWFGIELSPMWCTVMKWGIIIGSCIIGVIILWQILKCACKNAGQKRATRRLQKAIIGSQAGMVAAMGGNQRALIEGDPTLSKRQKRKKLKQLKRNDARNDKAHSKEADKEAKKQAKADRRRDKQVKKNQRRQAKYNRPGRGVAAAPAAAATTAAPVAAATTTTAPAAAVAVPAVATTAAVTPPQQQQERTGRRSRQQSRRNSLAAAPTPTTTGTATAATVPAPAATTAAATPATATPSNNTQPTPTKKELRVQKQQARKEQRTQKQQARKTQREQKKQAKRAPAPPVATTQAAPPTTSASAPLLTADTAPAPAAAPAVAAGMLPTGYRRRRAHQEH